MNTLRVKAVARKMDTGVSTVWKIAKTDPTFPAPFKLAPQVTVWDEDELNQWLESRKGASREVQ